MGRIRALAPFPPGTPRSEVKLAPKIERFDNLPERLPVIRLAVTVHGSRAVTINDNIDDGVKRFRIEGARPKYVFLPALLLH